MGRKRIDAGRIRGNSRGLPLRIAFATLSEDPGKPTGSLDFFRQTVAGLAAHRPADEFLVFVSRANRHLFEPSAPNVRLIEAGSSNEHRLRRILSEQLTIPRLLRRHRADVFFTSSGGGVAPLRIPRGTKLVLAVYATQHLRSDLRMGLLRSLYRRWLAIPSLKRADRVIVNSQVCLEEICTQVDIREKAAVIHHGMDPRRFHDGPLDEAERTLFERHGVRGPFVLFLSTIYFYKNVHTLVEAFGRLVTETGLPHELVLVGRFDARGADGGEYGRMLRETARRHGVEDRLRFTGPVPDAELRAFYRMAAAYVQPSFYETFGKTVAEAFWCGCPVIGANTSATPEIVGDAGLLFDPHKPEELTACLRRVLLDSALRENLTAKGRERARLFSVEREVAQISAVLHEAAGVKAGPPREPSAPRLLQVFSRYVEPGGEEQAVDRIAHLLSERQEIAECRFENRDWLGPSAPPWLCQAVLMIRNPSALRALREAHAAFQPEAWMVHNVFPVGSASIFREALRRRIPLIYYVHNFRPFSVNGYLWDGARIAPGGLRKNYWQEIRSGAWQESVVKTAWFAFVLWLTHRLGWFRAVKAWIAVSEFMRAKFIEAGIPAEDIFTVRHAWRPMTEPPPPQDGGFWLFLGRLVPAKGIAVLFEAWKIIGAELGARAPRLVIAGAGPSEPWVVEEARGNPFVEFRGSVSGDSKHQLLASCRGIVVPSLWWEPLGLVAYEAYDYGKPVLAARSGGLPEIVEHGATGLLHEAGNAAELALQVIELEADPGRRAAMGRLGRAWLFANAGEDEWRRKITEVVRHAMR